MTMTVIEARSLTKTYLTQAEQVVALNEVNLTVKTGDFIIINGPSGSGKTTFLNLISGLDLPSAGEVLLNGQVLHTLSDNQRTELRLRQIGLIFQSFELIPVLTVFENVEYPLVLQRLPRSERRNRVNRILAKVGLEKMANRFPAQLSGGQKQRVGIARALVTRPQIVLADEPTGSLDSSTGEQILRLMLELNNTYKVSFLIVTHDQAMKKYARRLLEIRDGVLTEKECYTDVQDRLSQYSAQ